MTEKKRRAQKRVPGQRRKPMGTAVLSAIDKAIERECARYGVSRSFVIANALAYTFGIEFDSYIDEEKEQKKLGRQPLALRRTS